MKFLKLPLGLLRKQQNFGERLRILILSGNGAPTGVYWVQRPQTSLLPSVVLYRISNIPDYTMDGPSGLIESRVQMDTFAKSYAEAKNTSRILINNISGFHGTIGDTKFNLVSIDGERDIYDASENDAERFYRVSVDLLIYHGSA
jgi:hypothetical protein